MLLWQQGLAAAPKRPARKADVLAAVRRMGVLQIDTISVVARSPYLVLYSRLGAYEPRWLDELLAAGKLFEYWAHAACFIPAEDFPLFASLITHGAPRYSDRVQHWLAGHQLDTAHVLERIRAEGALRSADFVSEKKPQGGWWNWKAEKLALEYLFLAGELMVARRDSFQRVYDLRERVRPDWKPGDVLPLAQVYETLVSKAALALGAATEPWLRDYYRLKRQDCQPAIAALLERGELVEARIEGIKVPAYVHHEVAKTLGGRRKLETGSVMVLLSPFDPLVWDRARCSALFGFDYRIEVYTPQQQRKYGYFVLPILHQGRLIGRLCPKAHRREGVFELRSLHLEQGVKPKEEDWQEVAAAIQRCADWHGTPEVQVGASEPSGAARQLKAALRKQIGAARSTG